MSGIEITEWKKLQPVKILISNTFLHLELFEDKEENLFLSACTVEPQGTVYFATTLEAITLFIDGKTFLQELFNASPSRFVEHVNNDKSTLYSRHELEIRLKYGYRQIHELIDDRVEILRILKG